MHELSTRTTRWGLLSTLNRNYVRANPTPIVPSDIDQLPGWFAYCAQVALPGFGLSISPLVHGTNSRQRARQNRYPSWSGRQDSNLRPPGPKPGALPACATPRRRFG
jgi:hypothetical protein